MEMMQKKSLMAQTVAVTKVLEELASLAALADHFPVGMAFLAYLTLTADYLPTLLESGSLVDLRSLVEQLVRVPRHVLAPAEKRLAQGESSSDFRTQMVAQSTGCLDAAEAVQEAVGQGQPC